MVFAGTFKQSASKVVMFNRNLFTCNPTYDQLHVNMSISRQLVEKIRKVFTRIRPLQIIIWRNCVKY